MKRGLLLVLAALALAARASAQTTAPSVTAGVDRTAFWIGDRIVYTVDVVCGPDTDILPDDLAKEKLRLNGLEVLSSDVVTTREASDVITYRVVFVLTTYRVDNPSPSIEPIGVRFYARRAGQRLQNVAPAGEVRVPGAALALRSTLPENQIELALRDRRLPTPRQSVFARAAPIGLALVVVSVVPALVVAASAVRRRRAGQPARRSARQTRHDERAALERLRAIDVSNEADRRRALDEISTAVRGFVAAHSRVPAAALTATELDSALAAAGGRVSREAVVSLLAMCDEARYRPAAAVPSAEACRDALASAEQVLAGRH
jgi:hypothetical protein